MNSKTDVSPTAGTAPSAAQRSSGGDPVSRVAGWVLALFLLSVAGAVTWLYQATHGPKTGSVLPVQDRQPQEPDGEQADNGGGEPLLPQASKPGTAPSAAGSSPTKLTSKIIASFWATARNTHQPRPVRLQALAQLQSRSKVAPEELREIEALQAQLVEAIAAEAQLELKRRAEFIDAATQGEWLKQSTHDAEAAWRLSTR